MICAGKDQARLAEPVDLSRLVEEMLELLKDLHFQTRGLDDESPEEPARGVGQCPAVPAFGDESGYQRSGSDRREGRVIQVTIEHVSRGDGLTPNSVTELPQGDYVRHAGLAYRLH
jgi:hypothetical protein